MGKKNGCEKSKDAEMDMEEQYERDEWRLRNG
jgi:hypothetical protein